MLHSLLFLWKEEKSGSPNVTTLYLTLKFYLKLFLLCFLCFLSHQTKKTSLNMNVILFGDSFFSPFRCDFTGFHAFKRCLRILGRKLFTQSHEVLSSSSISSCNFPTLASYHLCVFKSFGIVFTLLQPQSTLTVYILEHFFVWKMIYKQIFCSKNQLMAR